MKAGAPISAVAILVGIIPVSLILATLSSGGLDMAISITSSAFTEGALIPKKHTCDAEDLSPDLKWS